MSYELIEDTRSLLCEISNIKRQMKPRLLSRKNPTFLGAAQSELFQVQV